MMRFLFALVALACAAAAYAVEPPVIREEPPSIVGQCECSTTGAPCICGDACSCTVPVIATLERNDTHTCTRCGTYANVVEREFANGTHSHRCGNCGNEWYHADPGVSLPAVQYVAAPANPFAVGDCASGNCARGSAPRISASGGSVVRVAASAERPRPLRRLLGVVFRPFRALRGGCCN